MMRIIFWGSPQFAVPILDAIYHSPHELVAVVSQPDKPVGRRRKRQSPPIVEYARAHDIATLQPVSPNSKEFIEHLQSLAPDANVVAAYGRILSKKNLSIPKHGCINVHFSILPKYRGASPVAAAILAGEKATGISIMQMAAKMDSGPVFAVERVEISPDDTAGELQHKLGQKAPPLLLSVLEEIAAGTAIPTPQCEEKASYCRILHKRDGEIPWGEPARYIERFVHAMTPWPTAYTRLQRRRTPQKVLDIILKKVAAVDRGVHESPGTVVEVGKRELVVACGTGCLQIIELQRRGKTPLSVVEFMRGAPVEIGDLFF